MSLYAEYIREKTHGDVVETDKGFATFVFSDSETCYIQDIYIRPEYRKQGAARDIAATIEEKAKARGCKRLLGSVVPSAINSTASLKVLLADGFLLESAANDFILFSKEI